MKNESEKNPSTLIIIIGNELLSGQIRDENGYFLARELTNTGFKIEKIIFLPDDKGIISKELSENYPKYDYIFVTGGIGPTHDDVTLEAVAKAFNKKLVVLPQLVKIISDYFKDDLTSADLKMASVPENTELITFDELEFPILKYEKIYLLPGIPEILRKKVKCLLRNLSFKKIYKKIIEIKCREGLIAEYISNIVKQYNGISIGIYPKLIGKSNILTIVIKGDDKYYVDKVSNLIEKYGEEKCPKKEK